MAGQPPPGVEEEEEEAQGGRENVGGQHAQVGVPARSEELGGQEEDDEEEGVEHLVVEGVRNDVLVPLEDRGEKPREDGDADGDGEEQ